jgi:hypothetical protein
MKKVVILFAVLFLITTGTLEAQTSSTLNPADITGIITIVTTPENPAPYEGVTAKIEASGLTLNSSLITWRVDGSTVKSGVGERSIVFSTGGIGTRSTVSVTIESPEGTFTKSLVVSPSEIDFLWQGETYVPPFYKGRSLWTSQTTLTIMAIPHIGSSNGGELDPKNLNYRWKQNGKVLGSLSGKGANSIVINDSILSIPQTIRLDILSDQNTILASSAVTIAPNKASLAIYEKNPLYGISFHKEVGATYRMREQEVTFAAFPLFFGTKSLGEGILQYAWRTNAGNTDLSNTVTYRAPGNAEGSSQISVKVSNLSKVLQTGQKSFLVQFGLQR